MEKSTEFFVAILCSQQLKNFPQCMYKYIESDNIHMIRSDS